jgi:SAM-dependent methyltransferase
MRRCGGSVPTVACNICGSRDADELLVAPDRLFPRDREFHLVRCRSCALVFVNPQPEPAVLSEHYPPEYGQMLSADPAAIPAGVIKVADMLARRRLPRGGPPGRGLEIGIGGGAYLRALRGEGWTVDGVEMSAALSDRARGDGFTVHTGTAEDVLPGLPADSYDLVAMWHVIEHLTDPRGVLSEIRRILKPGGRLLLELPNYDGYARAVFGSYWAALDLPRHLYHFTPATLAVLLQRVGFRPTDIHGVPAAVVTTMSLQLLLNTARGKPTAGLVFNPLLLVPAFPLSVLLAKAGRSSHMLADATKA